MGTGAVDDGRTGRSSRSHGRRQSGCLGFTGIRTLHQKAGLERYVAVDEARDARDIVRYS